MTNLSIKSMGEQDRPREKALQLGIKSLTDAELLSIIIGSGNGQENAVRLSQRILQHVEHNINTLAKVDIVALQNFKGIGPAKAISISAAMELSNRINRPSANEKPVSLRTSALLDRVFRPQMRFLKQEQFWVLFMSQGLFNLGLHCFSTGGINCILVDLRLIFQKALQLNATCIVVAHNHPSGRLKPSRYDCALTKKIASAGNLMDIKLMDHMILTDDDYYSFSDKKRPELEPG